MRQLYKNRDYTGLFATSFNEMHQRDPEQFKKRVRMTPAVFDMLLELLKKRQIGHPYLHVGDYF